MQKIHHLFVIDPLADLNLKLDSSLRIAAALGKLDHEIWLCSPEQLEWLSQEGCASAAATQVKFPSDQIEHMQVIRQEHRLLSSFQAIHMRKDPPYDMNYITCTWMLDSAEGQGVKVFNSPKALRTFNEKLGILRFPQNIQKAFLSSNSSRLFDFLRETANGDAILKPLTLFGGRGVIRLNREAMSDQQILSILEEETQSGKDLRLMQPFDKRIFQGEVRVFTAKGKAISWCLKLPKGDNFLANTRSGAVLQNYLPTAKERDLIESVAQTLVADGIILAGFDVIGGYISEINITSPRLLHATDDTHDYYGELATILCSCL